MANTEFCSLGFSVFSFSGCYLVKASNELAPVHRTGHQSVIEIQAVKTRGKLLYSFNSTNCVTLSQL